MKISVQIESCKALGRRNVLIFLICAYKTLISGDFVFLGGNKKSRSAADWIPKPPERCVSK